MKIYGKHKQKYEKTRRGGERECTFSVCLVRDGTEQRGREGKSFYKSISQTPFSALARI
jgi:hypothetical protein